MNDIFEQLVIKARNEVLPTIDVSLDVIEQIKSGRITFCQDDSKSLGVMAAVVSIAASLIISFAIYIRHERVEPLDQLSYAVAWVYEDYGEGI